MPLYDYECNECGRRTEVLQRMSDPPLEACPHCGGKVRRLLSAPAVQFKGTGWYVTDYARKKGEGSASSGGAAGSSGSKGEGTGEKASTGASGSAGSSEKAKSGGSE